MSNAWGSSFGVAWGSSWGSGATPTPTPGRSGLGGDDVPRHKRASPNARGWDRKEYERQKAEEGKVEATLREVYADLTGESSPVSVLARVDAIVRPVSKQEAKDLPLRIDWAGMARDYERAERLMKLYREEMELRALIEEEDEILLML